MVAVKYQTCDHEITGLTCSQWTDHLEQSAACTTSTRAVQEHFRMCSEDASVSSARHCWDFYAIRIPNINTLTYLLTYCRVTTVGILSPNILIICICGWEDDMK